MILLFLALLLPNCEKVEANPTPTPSGKPSSSAASLASSSASSVLKPVYDISLRTNYPPLDSLQSYLDWMLKNTTEEKDQLINRWNRAKEAIARRDLTKKEVIYAFLLTPREHFCRPANKSRAYIDNYMAIGYGQTISGPHLVARMTCELDLKPDHKVLEIGTGSGYQAAVLSQLANFVYTIEVIKPLAEETIAIYEKLKKDYPQYQNIKFKIADGYYGWEEYAPFDRIIVTCGIDHIPPPLLAQLKPEGIMLIPVGPPAAQHVLKVIKHVMPDGKISYEKKDIYNGRIVPFVNFTVDGKERHSIARDKPEQQ